MASQEQFSNTTLHYRRTAPTILYTASTEHCRTEQKTGTQKHSTKHTCAHPSRPNCFIFLLCILAYNSLSMFLSSSSIQQCRNGCKIPCNIFHSIRHFLLPSLSPSRYLPLDGVANLLKIQLLLIENDIIPCHP